ncbi:hypothetical protein [Xanthomonas theicola]|uniref:hypothetical protein n=1 Tax=Xanthomonas theicola TaxID=56464 RepID=UPI000FF8865E|nr:hypothetical protein [Xanthomonas theicola]QNH26484.1 hypothetical protein G4Q83_19595 [Xanthomonas theicola]
MAAAVYGAHAAAVGDRRRRQRSGRARRSAEGTALFQRVHDPLAHERWSARQIAARRRAMHPDDANQRTGRETICAAIDARLEAGADRDLATGQTH